ncbi:hypothetical protein PEBR_21211 [Penicillium brasilianum]|uniref:RGS domain-containing protein n=1 Tax=Penicillium brasilianum TaxID=104259 RepID=A0A1S9RLR9_PENBI|nr:hypothetical protein PEBR_21211 [Penicillium brasilianum]
MPPSRSTLDDALSGQSSGPYTYNALLEFLTQGHCMETLNFISEAKSYRDLYSLYSISVDSCNLIRDTTLVAKQWKRLISTYVSPESPSQINLPDDIREQLLEPGDAILSPPNPERLGLAIDYAYEIITEDALLPFTSSLQAEDTYAIRLGYSPSPSLNQSLNSYVLSKDLSCPVNDANDEM